MSNRIGEAIKKGLEKKRLTQSQLAERMGVTNATITHWVQGKYFPPGDKFLRLIDVLDIARDLFPGRPPMQSLLESTFPTDESLREHAISIAMKEGRTKEEAEKFVDSLGAPSLHEAFWSKVVASIVIEDSIKQ